MKTNHTLPGADDITRVRLENGITVLARANFASPSVVISGYMATGSLNDTDEKLGLSYFTSLGLMRGTQKRSFQQIFDALESAGASLGFSAGVHTTGFSGRALAEDLPLLLDVLVETSQQPIFPASEMERLRAQMLTGLAMRAQDTGEMASLTFDQMIYAGHPYRRPEDGYTETIQAITQKDILEYHRRWYGPRDMVIVAVGAVEPQQVVDMVEKTLGGWQNPQQPPAVLLPPLEPLSQPAFQKYEIPGKVQSDLIMGVIGPYRKSDDYLAASLGNNILGQFGMMGRIGKSVRERSGLAYYAYSAVNAGIGPGTWEVSAGVNPRNLSKAEALTRKEIARFANKKVFWSELRDSQANYIGRLPLSLESNGGVASALLNLQRYDLDLDYYRTYADRVRVVTPANVLEAAHRYWDLNRLVVAVAGP
ncbi:MAG: pitrilysin family protein [Anaerolineaceae bacterium]